MKTPGEDMLLQQRSHLTSQSVPQQSMLGLLMGICTEKGGGGGGEEEKEGRASADASVSKA